MQCLWLENRQLTVRQVDDPRPGPGEALLRVRVAGVCGTDLALLSGDLPYTGIPGHEFVGQVMAAPDDPSWVGRRVVGEINVACGDCPTCAAGRPRHCPTRSVLGIVNRPGVFADRVCLPLANLHAVPEVLSDEQAVFTEPVAAAVRITEQVTLGPDQRVLLVGAGRLGQLIAQVLIPTGCRLHALAKHTVQRNALRERAVTILHPDDLDSQAGSFDVVVEATGNASGFGLARRAVRPLGTVVCNSTFGGGTQVDLSALVVDEITVVGSRCGPFGPALERLADATVDPLPFVDATFPLDNAALAFEHARREGAFKVLIRPTG